MVGNDAYQQPWLDESLANWSASYFVDQTAGADSGLMARDIFVRLPYLLILLDHDERLDQTVDRFSAEEYAGVVYGKGALMYDVLRKQLGDAKFFEFLRRYEQANEFKRADGAAWQQALAQVAGADTAGAFYAKWVEGASVQESDLPPGGPVADLFNNPLARELLRALLKEMQSTSQPK
jgi:aminopeptidase N